MENFFLTKKNTVRLSEDSYLFTFEEKLDFEPTQFIMIENSSVTRKPFALGRWKGDLAIGIQVVGPGTEYIAKQKILRAHGPLGRPFQPSGRGAIIVSLACVAMAFDLQQRLLGEVFVGSLKKPFVELPFKVVTGDEQFTELLKSLNGYDWYLIVGSEGMEKVSYELLKDRGEVFLSLNEYMACGIGACKGCAVETRDGIKHVCVDGPVFRGDLLCI